MDYLITAVLLLGLVWLGMLIYQVVLGQKIKQPVHQNSHVHPTIAVQQALTGSNQRGWTAELRGNTVVARHGGSRAEVCVDIAPAAHGSSVTGSIRNSRTGSVAGIKTHVSGQSLLKQRSTMLASIR